MKQPWANEKTFFPFLLCLILLLHLGAMVLHLNFSSDTKLASGVEKEKRIVIRIDPDEFKLKKQIVQSEDSEKRDLVEGAFLSDKTRSFDRQTRARKNDIFHAGSKSGGRARQGTKEMKLSDLGAAVGEDPFKKAAEEYSKAKSGDGVAQSDRKVSSTNDYIEEIPLGDATELNTVEYRYYGFYYRIRQKLEQFWGRTLQDKAAQLARSGRRMPASEDLITALEITLDHQGEIIAIKVRGTSGVKELDDAAIESFNDAGPFPNPPKGLIVDGKVTLEWGFVVKS